MTHDWKFAEDVKDSSLPSNHFWRYVRCTHCDEQRKLHMVRIEDGSLVFYKPERANSDLAESCNPPTDTQVKQFAFILDPKFAK